MTKTGRGFEAHPVRRASAAEQIAHQIRDAIRDGRLAEGERLPPEHDLAADFDVSRATVREAMRMLSAAKLVEASRGAAGGTFIALPSRAAAAESLSDTIEMWFATGNTSTAEVDVARGWIERGCMRLAALSRTAEDLRAITEAYQRGAKPDIDTDLFLAYDLEFHVAISRATHNTVMELAMTAIHLARPRTNTLLLAVLEPQPVIEQHAAILNAIEARDADAAEHAFIVHFDHMMGVQRAALENRRADDIPLGSLTETHPAIEILKSRLPWHASHGGHGQA